MVVTLRCVLPRLTRSLNDESDQSGTIPAVPTQLTELPMWQSARPIETAPHHTYQERPLLLWCPEQGGWQTGMWFNGRWMDSITLSHPLAPTFWTEIPPPPMPISHASGPNRFGPSS